MKHIYELTPTQARELKKLVENKSSYGKGSTYDKDYIVSGGHKETISFWCGKHVSVVQNVPKLLQPSLIKSKITTFNSLSLQNTFYKLASNCSTNSVENNSTLYVKIVFNLY